MKKVLQGSKRQALGLISMNTNYLSMNRSISCCSDFKKAYFTKCPKYEHKYMQVTMLEYESKYSIKWISVFPFLPSLPLVLKLGLDMAIAHFLLLPLPWNIPPIHVPDSFTLKFSKSVKTFLFLLSVCLLCIYFPLLISALKLLH